MISKIINRVAARGGRELMKRGYFRDVWYPKYQFQFFPRQLCFLAKCLDKIANVDGSIIEIGCAHGLTTTFLYEYLIDSKIDKKYMCVDTFSGFAPSDISFERTERGKRHPYENEFKDNNIEWFKESLSRRHITDIEIIEGDICKLDADLLPERVAFCLLDVDLYQPVRAGLSKIYPRLSPGGVIVIDDCWSQPEHRWVKGLPEAYDGAMQAYKEFTEEQGLPMAFAETKLALVERT